MQINTILQGDVLEKIKEIPDNSVDCIITSPPYWSLRFYTLNNPKEIGNEPTPEEYINNIVRVCLECFRILKPTGNFFLNLGDTYFGGGNHRKDEGKHKQSYVTIVGNMSERPKWDKMRDNGWLQRKQKLLIPHRIAIKLQEEGFILREDIVWAKKVTKYPERTSIGTCLPHPVTDRFVNSLEYVFHFVKQPKDYFFDLSKVKNFTKETSIRRSERGNNTIKKPLIKINDKLMKGKGNWGLDYVSGELSNPTNVLMFKRNNQFTKKEKHYAIFPECLAEFFIKVGCPEKGIVFDSFIGSGTVAVVALKLNRNFLGIELNPDYVKMVDKRIKPLLQQKKLDNF